MTMTGAKTTMIQSGEDEPRSRPVGGTDIVTKSPRLRSVLTEHREVVRVSVSAVFLTRQPCRRRPPVSGSPRRLASIIWWTRSSVQAEGSDVVSCQPA